ncbi:hyalin-like [Ptychodera flava]|uniref:hyalin-like n=1 Tax=Ptychodera flava TaxID=63121 RepID=UPI00396A8E32
MDIECQAHDEPPTILCPDNIDVDPEPGEATVVVHWTQPNATDNSGYVTVTSDYQSGTEFSIGSTSIHYNASDPSGNVDSCQFNVTVPDVVNPEIICPGDIEVVTDPGQATAVVTWTSPNATDNSGSVTLSSNYQPGAELVIGSTIISYNATDPFGNVDSCNFNVTVTDVENPSIICPDDIEEYTDPGEDTAVVTWSQPNATDNSGSVNVTSNYQQGSNFVIGSTVVYYNASDPYGNVDSCLFTVTVIDDEPPTILCPDNIDVDPEPGEATVVVNWTQPNATDNSGYVTVTSDYQSGTEFSIGSTSIHYNASDPSGNVDSCQFNVTVPDVVNPEIICPGDIEVVTDPGQATAVVTWTSPNATDNSGSVTLSSNYQPGAELVIGSTIISYNATDPFGNVDSCNFNVTVTDVENPSILCPDDIEEYTDPGEDTAVVTWSQPNATDNSGSVNVTSNYQQGSNFVIGSTVVYYNASDPYGNVDSCLFTVTVIDVVNPEIICPGDIEVVTDPGQATAVVTWTSPNATDNSGSVTLSSNYQPGAELVIGSTIISYNATDPFGNVDSCNFNVTVTDVENPSILCPDDIEEYTDPGEDTAVVTWSQPNATDNSGSVNVTSNYQQGSNFVIGSTVVYYNASDPYGNVDSCLFTVTVIDDEPPTILCPDNIDVDPEPGEATVVVNWTQPNATDNSGYVTVTSDYQSGLSSASVLHLSITMQVILLEMWIHVSSM